MKKKKTTAIHQVGDVKRIKDVNFFERYYKAEKAAKTVSKSEAIQTVIIGIIAIGCLTTTSVLNVVDNQLESKVEDLRLYLSSPSVSEQIKVLEEKVALQTALNKYEMSLGSAEVKLASHIRINKQMIEEVTQNAQRFQVTEIESMTYEQGTLTLQCRANRLENISAYVSALRQITFVQKVSYNGANEVEAGNYMATITLTLVNEEGTDEANE